MSGDGAIRITTAITAFDGVHADSLKSIAEQVEATPAVMGTLCDFAASKEESIQSASTWLLRRYVQNGATLSPAQTAQALNVLTRNCHWEARLHILQMMDELRIPSTRVEQLWRSLLEYTTDDNKFIRAWSFHGLAVIADQHPPYRTQALKLLANAEEEGAASVRARIRGIRKALKWAG